MPFSDYLIAIPMALAIISLWFSGRAWIVLVLIALAIGFIFHQITLPGLVMVAIGFGLAALIAHNPNYSGKRKEESTLPSLFNKSIQVILHSLLIFWVLLTFSHLLPGFNNVLLLDKVYANQDAIPFTLYFNVDKSLTICVLFLAWPSILGNRKTIKEWHWQAWLVTFMGFIMIQVLACVIGLVRPDFKIPDWWWLFAFNNLLITCVAEEAFFRGYLQQQLSRLLGVAPGWLLTSCLFGLAHYQGGWIYAVLAALAGIGYGAVFLITGRLWVSIITHFLFNMTHLIFYTYPMLKQ
ncbi:CPBP family intramembrane metalloprotease [Endozoicomonas sp. Mp262]|uniref:CPBP family intramembrane glutamic endopeptidase n=1 Tax=Endozoicomonas sp. Mp262 TaxID=2919499 RepID=UPI0021DAFFF5